MSDKHTPGPYELVPQNVTLAPFLICDSDGTVLAQVIGGERLKDQVEANAHLFKAALKLLETLMEYAEAAGPIHESGCPQDDTCDCKWKPLNDKINAVINEALGKET